VRWGHGDLNARRVKAVLRLPTGAGAALASGDAGFAEQGRSSAGARRQCSGTPGKVGSRRVTVNRHYAERTVAWPVAARLYLPEEGWASDQPRRGKAGAPRGAAFQTKPRIAPGLLDAAGRVGVVCPCVVAGAGHGDGPSSSLGPESRDKPCVVAVRKNFQVALNADGRPCRPGRCRRASRRGVGGRSAGARGARAGSWGAPARRGAGACRRQERRAWGVG
jgi:SRSO17 transposase